jgi:hypothetical protein
MPSTGPPHGAQHAPAGGARQRAGQAAAGQPGQLHRPRVQRQDGLSHVCLTSRSTGNNDNNGRSWGSKL